MHLIITKLDIQPGFDDYGQVHKFDKVASSEFPENVYIQLPIATCRVPKKENAIMFQAKEAWQNQVLGTCSELKHRGSAHRDRKEKPTTG